jgi:hypothetical protein
MKELSNGDIIGLLLDLDEQSMAVYLNNTRIGLLVSRASPKEIAPLAAHNGPIQWIVALSRQSSVKMAASSPPLELADATDAELQWTRDFWAVRTRTTASPQPWQGDLHKAEDTNTAAQLTKAYGFDAEALFEKCASAHLF